MTQLEGKIVLITGASSGIGEAMAYEAAAKNATVLLCARREDKLKEVKDKCESISNKPAYVYTLDVSDPDDIDNVMDRIKAEVGAIDVLINNAGFGHSETFLSYDLKKAESMFRVNVLGLMYLSQIAAIQMADRRSGHIINVGSIAGKVATPKSSVYSASKFAVIGFSNALRLELKPLNIKVTTINPGPVDTAFFDEFDPSGDYLNRIRSFVLTSQEVAEKTIKVIGTNKREVNLPFSLGVASKFYSLFPALGDYLILTSFDKK
ncbi:SDR family NAD(P)-dependent oxidoreductase [Marinilactibacillus piezotolerans]|uniref:SDR family NAD(P)-dependent oxidoreductase n=1 Tax=Marinilactibacillus piezotolerans TaxID=258723 RepID=UPI0009B146B3|nr:SDR family oxidoreductase [Marinilactibacillus piezotolerans]